jgi:hypothetical protein
MLFSLFLAILSKFCLIYWLFTRKNIFSQNRQFLLIFAYLNIFLIILRIHPRSFIRQLNLPYPALYDRGYTSLGDRRNTAPNANLMVTDADGKTRSPFYELSISAKKVFQHFYQRTIDFLRKLQRQKSP